MSTAEGGCSLERWDPRERRDPTLFEVFIEIANSENGRSPKQIARAIQAPQQLVVNAVRKLLERHYVMVEGAPGQVPERDATVRVTTGFCVLGVRIRPDELIGVATDLRGRVLHDRAGAMLRGDHRLRSADPHAQHPEPEEVVKETAHLVHRLIEKAQRLQYRPIAVGAEVAGHVHPRSGEVVYSPNLGWRNVSLAKRLKEELDLEVAVENDANALAVGEQWFGDGRGRSNFAVLLLSEGVGCGLVLNNDLFHGASGMAGEFGHIVVQPGGPPCRCPNYGCLEGIASTSGIVGMVAHGSKARGIEDDPLTLAAVVKLARRDPVARHAFQAAGDALARAIGALLNLVNPEQIIIESLQPEAALLLERATKPVLPLYAFSSALTDCDIKWKQPEADFGAKSAAAVAISRFLNLSLE